jgi:hypothetical protein
MMNEEMMRQMQSMHGGMMSHPMAQGAMMAATGFAAGRGLFSFNPLKNPLVMLAGGLVAGYLIHKYEKDFALHQKENLEDLVAEAQEKEAQAARPAAEPKP